MHVCMFFGSITIKTIAFYNNLTEAKIANELMTLVQSLNILHLNLHS